jgi:molybdopterin-guanine dinucleotide biosynthesis protein A
LQQGELKIIKTYQGMRVREVTGEELKRFDPDLHTLSNFNTPEELKKLLETYPNTPL